MVAQPADKLRDAAERFFRKSDLPEALEWVSALSPVNQRLFAVELAAELEEATATGELDALSRLIEDWRATATLDDAPEVLREVRRRKKHRPISTFTA